MRQTLKEILIVLGCVAALGGLGGIHYLENKRVEYKPNWSRRMAGISGTFDNISVSASRNGGLSYTSSRWDECDPRTKRMNYYVVTDTDNEGFPERELVIFGCDGSMYTRTFDKDKNGRPVRKK